MPTIIEITTFTASEAFLADPNILTPTLDSLVRADGCLGVYHGIAEEDNKTIFLYVVWETFGHHKTVLDPDFASSPDEINVKNVEFIPDPLPALNAPATEILDITLKEGKTKEDLYEVLTLLASTLDVDSPYPPVARGESREELGQRYAVVLGWSSSKEHLAVVGQPSYKDPIQKLIDTADFKMFHAALKKHSA